MTNTPPGGGAEWEWAHPYRSSTTVMPDFLGTTWVGLTHLLSKIGYMIPASNNLTTSLSTTSLIFGLSHRCISLVGLAFFSKFMRCIHKEGSIPLRSATDQPISPLCLCKVVRRALSWSFSKLEEMMTGRVSFGPRYAYLSDSSKGLSSRVGGHSRDDLRTSLGNGGKGSNIGFHLGVIMQLVVSRMEFTCSIDPSMSNVSTLKWSRQASKGSLASKEGKTFSTNSSITSIAHISSYNHLHAKKGFLMHRIH